MRKDIINMAAIGIFTLALTACGNAASNQPEAKAEKSVTEIPADSIIKLLEPDKTLDVSLMQALSDRASQREFADKLLCSGLLMASIARTANAQLLLPSIRRMSTSMSVWPAEPTSMMQNRASLPV